MLTQGRGSLGLSRSRSFRRKTLLASQTVSRFTSTVISILCTSTVAMEDHVPMATDDFVSDIEAIAAELAAAEASSDYWGWEHRYFLCIL